MRAGSGSDTFRKFWKFAAAVTFALSLPDRALPQAVATPGEVPGQSSTLLADGRRLLVGGQARGGPLADVAILDPATGEATKLAGALGQARAWHTATMLPNGTVLILGGVGSDGRILSQAEVFDPATGSVQPFAPVFRGRAYHSATMLTDGRLLVAGGVSDNGMVLATAELWDTRSGLLAVSEGPMVSPRSGHAAVLQPDGSVFFAGGRAGVDFAMPPGEVFDGVTKLFVPAAARTSYVEALEGSLPEDGADGVRLDPVLALRFSKPLRVETVSAATVVLRGPGGEAVETKLVAAEEGLLLFITPAQPLQAGGRYTISVDGVAGGNGAVVPPAEVHFTTAGGNSGGAVAEGAAGIPLLPAPFGRGATSQSNRNSCICEPCLIPPEKAPSLDCGAQAGDPVDCATGLFIHTKTDLTLPGVAPLALTRTYQSGNDKMWAFGKGATHNYDMFLLVPSTWEYADVILPSGTRVHFTALSVWPDHSYATYEHTASPTVFYKSTVSYDYACDCWTLWLKDGTRYIFFGDILLLQSIEDRHGNRIDLKRAQALRYSWGVGNVVQISAPGGRWIQFSYDSSNRVVMAQDNMGRKVNYEYDGGGRLFKVTDAEGGVTEYGYDATGRMLTIKDARGIVYLTNEFDANGRVWRQTMIDGGVSTYAYTLNNKTGLVKQTDVTDPRATVRRMEINATGWRTTDTLIAGGTQQKTTFTRQADTNLLTRLEDPLGRKTDYAYDGCGNVTGVTRLAGTSNAVTTTLTYQPKLGGSVLCVGWYNQVTSITDPLNHATTFGYDLQGKNLTSVQGPIPSIPATQFGYNDNGQVTSVTDALNKVWQFGYSGAGHLASIRDPLQRTSTRVTDYAGRLGMVTNPLGQATHYEYDNVNRLRKVTDPLLGTTELGYDPNGNLLSVKDARDGITSYAYESMDRLQTRTDPLLKPEGYLYDLNGNLTRFTDRKQQPTNFTYDGFNRMTRADYADGSWTTYTYDLADRLTQVVDSISGTITLTWDGLDRLTREVTPQGTVDYTYNAAGRRTSMTVAGQPTVTYTYDNADRLTQVTQGTSTVTLEYDAADRRTKTTLPNGVSMGYTYDDAGQLTKIEYKQGETVLGDLTYEYDTAGNRTSVGGSYARTGLPQAVSSVVYDAANRLTQWNGTPLTYDDNGNLTSDGTATYTWNARDKLASMTGASFQYDPLGRRTRKTVGGVTTSFLYDGVNAVQEISGTAANLLTGLGVDEVFSRTDSAGARHFLADALGSTIGLTDGAGAIQTQYTYEPYGKVTVSGAGSGNPFQYTGRENDGTGVYYYRARYYSPGLQRFLSPDPIGFAGGFNFYNYVGNGPMNWIDPTGLEKAIRRCAAEKHDDCVKRVLEEQHKKWLKKEQAVYRTIYQLSKATAIMWSAAGTVAGAYTGGLGGAIFWGIGLAPVGFITPHLTSEFWLFGAAVVHGAETKRRIETECP